MKRQIGKMVYVGKGKNRWNSRKWGRVVGVGNDRYYKVQFECGRITWIRKDWILFYIY